MSLIVELMAHRRLIMPKVSSFVARCSLHKSQGTNGVSRTWRTFATSAEKRKWKRQGMSKKEKQIDSVVEEMLEKNSKEESKDVNPFLFLVVFPVVMTGLVVTLRQDLREELIEKGRRFGGMTKE